MPSLRKRVSSYFRQLSFYNEPRERKHNINENSFVTKYLEGYITIREGPSILYGKNPTDLPNYDLALYSNGPDTIIGCYSGPNGGLTTVKRLEKHLSIPDTDIDYIDTQDELDEANSTPRDVPQTPNDASLPNSWSRKSDHVFGISDSLYDCNQVTKCKNGDPIADCFGIIARNDSAILAVADGVNWGEKASIAAKAAVHGCLHYLDKTIFNSTKPFDDLTAKADAKPSPIFMQNRVTNTREVFVSLLRAFNCAHDLILENDGMLTTLTVAVILPLRQKNVRSFKKDSLRREQQMRRPSSDRSGRIRTSCKDEDSESYVCCVCNVGDTLAYVYSQKYGVRELTKGSHDINCNRDMRDALGALGPVDGIKPELSNLTLSVTTVQRGDIILVASDGLTDNFDPNVCKFTINSKDVRPKRPASKERSANRRSQEIKDEPKLEAKSEVQRKASVERKVSNSSIKDRPQIQRNNERSSSGRAPVKPPRKNKDLRTSREQSVESFASSTSKESSPQDKELSNLEELKPSELTPHSSSESQPTSSSHMEKSRTVSETRKSHQTMDSDPDLSNPLVAQFLRENSLEEKSTKSENPKPLRPQSSQQVKRSESLSQKIHFHKTVTKSIPKPDQTNVQNKGGFLRSKTTLEMRTSQKTILRNEDGIPFVTPLQRYEISLLLMEDILKHGISGQDTPITTAKKVCENLVNFTFSISSAKRHTLEDTDLYFDNINGVLVEVSQQEKKLRRRKGLEKVLNLPGKLDHVSIVAYNVGNISF